MGDVVQIRQRFPRSRGKGWSLFIARHSVEMAKDGKTSLIVVANEENKKAMEGLLDRLAHIHKFDRALITIQVF